LTLGIPGRVKKTPTAEPSRRRERPRRATRGLVALLLGGDIAAFLAVSAVAGIPDPVQVLVVVLAVAGWTRGGLYRFRFSLSLLDDLPYLLGALLAAVGMVSVVGWLVGSSGAGREAVPFACGIGVTVAIVRSATYAVARRVRARGALIQRVIVLRVDEVGRRLLRDVAGHPEYGMRVVGLAGRPNSDSGYRPARLQDAGAEPPDFAITDVDAVVAPSAIPEDQLIALVRRCGELGRDVYIVPRLYDPRHVGAVDDRVWRVPLVRMRRPVYLRSSWRAKRMADVLLAGTALVMLAPVLLATALAVRLSVGRPVVFRQMRMGRGGRLFTLLKFSSLQPIDEVESHTRWSIGNDKRLGTVGRIIRATSLDELPQLVNILRGDMSIVGPRPERPYFVQSFAKEIRGYDDRHRVRGGLTGWAAVHGLRGDTSIEERADFDNFYIENWSPWMDVKVILRTVPALLRRVEPRQVPAGSSGGPAPEGNGHCGPRVGQRSS
jgi:exopolysaccharide biosynthesis polyprenyl glycosylphosphotransferase